MILSHLLAMLMWQAGRVLPLVALLGVALALVVAVLYIPQTPKVRWRWRWGLFGLRTLAVLALAASILQPVVTRPATPESQGAIVILVDRSHSMGIKDRQRGTEPRDRQRRHAALVGLADGLGRLPPGVRVRGEEFSAAIAAARLLLDEVLAAQSQVDYAIISGRGGVEARARLHSAAAEFDAAVSALAGRQDKSRPKAPLAVALGNLQRLEGKPRDENWGQSMRGGIDAVAAAAENFQIASDETLYNSNPDVHAVCDELAGLSRIELVEQAIVRAQTGLLWNLPAGGALYGFSVGNNIAPLPLRGGGRPVRRLMLDTESTGSDLAAAVRSALDQLRGIPVQAVVLFSDGRQSAAERSTVAPAVGVPVYTVAAAPAAPSKDLSLSQVALPSGAYAGETFSVSARVRGTGMQGAAVDVRCFAGPPILPPPIGAVPRTAALSAVFWAVASDVLDPPKRVQLGPTETADVEFDARINSPGAQRVTLRIPERPDEITTENNLAERWIKIFPGTRKITLIAAAPVWDERYLRDFLAASPGVEFHEHLVDDQPLPMSASEILAQDAIVLFDVPVKWLDAAQQFALRRLVEERGGGVVLVAGPDHLPAEYADGPLADLLPYASSAQGASKLAWQNWGGDDPAYHFLPPAGVSDPLRLADNDTANHRAWDVLPPLYRYLRLPALRPGAQVLLAERESGAAMIAEAPLGRGRVILMGIDAMWRWRHKTGGRDFERVWRQLLDRVVEPPYAASSGRLSFDVARAAVAPGEAVAVRARLVEADGSPSALASLDLRVLRDAAPVRSQSLSADLPGGRFSGILPGLPTGDYVLELSGDAQTVRYPLRVFGRYEAELEDASGDRAALDKLAKTNGGEMLSLEQVNHLPSLLAALAREPRSSTLNLWDSSYLFVFVVACFVLEWALRKRLGLA